LDIQIVLIPCTRSAAIAFAATNLFPSISEAPRETNICIWSRYTLGQDGLL
jgi:hypothetical protein